MTEEQHVWFDKLYQIRNKTAETLMTDFAVSNMWDTVIEKYSDQAHFIYELLQNADDSEANKATFKLTNDGLYFKHNGTKRFWLSNPKTEKQDQENNELGDINAITAVAQSNKKVQSTIGKFGVGFKAVFQYTKTPHIYEQNFQFKIERFIVPQKLEKDLALRNSDETVFYFPFDKPEMPQDKAYTDVLEKLKILIYPTLFLSNLKKVKWESESEMGEYTKNIIQQNYSNDISYKKIELCHRIGQQQNKDKLYLFTRFTQHNTHAYSIGYFLDEKKQLTPKKLSAFCFFPTKEGTNLNFILHAPFLLTDSREGIHRSKEHNIEMVKLLAQLAADSLLVLKNLDLIDDDIIKIIPYKRIDYGHEGFFNDFYVKIKEKLQNEKLLPAKEGAYAHRENAYWADSPDLAKLFSNEQLSDLVENNNAKWVFTSISRTKDKEITEYIDGGSERSWITKEPNLIKANMDFEYKIAALITSNFIKSQSNEWLHKFYEYLSERKSYQEKFKTKPIFKDSRGNAVAAFEKNGKELHGILFLPLDETNSSYRTIEPELLQNDNTKEFVEKFGIKKPSLKDEIYNNILPLYESDGDIDTETHFKKFFNYWKKEGRPEDFINLIKDKEFVSFRMINDENTYRGRASEIYYPDSKLLEYFKTKAETRFVDLDDYNKFITAEKDHKDLKDFLLKLGVSSYPRIIKKEIVEPQEKERLNLNQSTYGYDDRNHSIDKILDGSKEVLENIDSYKSRLLWDYLGEINLKDLIGEHKYFHYSTHYQSFDSTTLKLLKKGKWLLKSTNHFVTPLEITINELADIYEKNKELEQLLDFKELVILSKAERIAKKFESEEEAEEARKALEEKKAKQKRKVERKTSSPEANTGFGTEDLGDAIESLDNLSKSVSKPNTEKEKTNTLPEFDEEELSKEMEGVKRQLEIKKKRTELAENLNNNPKYSYGWFEAYLQLLITYGEKNDTPKQKSISFQEIQPYKNTSKHFLLCGASSYVSPEIENADDFSISLVHRNGKKENIKVEGVSKKGQDLLVYCREGLPAKKLSRNFEIFKIEINFTPVIDLLGRLLKAFTNKNYIDEWQGVKVATPSLNYIYGPPGTGKTTMLCNHVKNALTANPNTNFLVLTPTNKAADVICKKLLDIEPDILTIRLSSPTDDELDEIGGVYVDTLNKKSLQNINVVATTIHRLPYFEINDEKDGEQYSYKLFKHNKWDYVIFDESSMTGLHYIIFALMALSKTNSDTKFIIAGDPKQIPPVIEINDKELENFDFQDENIYKMMNLESFDPNKQVIRKRDTIRNLKTQYRSIPQIGQLYSELSYSSLLEHERETKRSKPKSLPKKIKSIITNNVSFINIPLNQNDSIYRVNKLLYSSYHIYSAILVSEIIRSFEKENNGEEWTIGVIAPYKAQAVLLHKLISSYDFSENVNVISDTVHGFQGDECDIVFFICNPNNYFFTGHEKALLSKEYIYNVAISRAKDYLVVLHPYSINNPFINQIGISYKNNYGINKILKATDIEDKLFNDKSYIENNSYVSGHDNVNIFGPSKMKYFIKANDSTIDILLRDITVNNQASMIKKEKEFQSEPDKVEGVKILGKIDLSKFEKYKRKKN